MIGPALPKDRKENSGGYSNVNNGSGDSFPRNKVWYERINFKIGLKNALYGTIVGSVMGSFFGLQMGLNTVNVKRFGDVFDLLGKSSTKRTIVVKSIAGTSVTFGLFFATYQFINHSISCIRDDDTDVYQFPIAATLAGLPFIKVSYMNKNLPYAGAFIALDCYSWYSQSNENSVY
eukprot:g3280.t1